MSVTDLAEDPVDPQHSPEERAAAASRSSWVSVGVNLVLTITQGGVGMLWSAFRKLEQPDLVQPVHVIALWVAGGALIAKELLFRYMLSVAKRVKSARSGRRWSRPPASRACTTYAPARWTT